MIRTGLVSVTFRQFTPEEIIALVVKSRLDAIEWGGDVHVAPNNPKLARKVSQMTTDAGLKVAGYASYYRVGESPLVEFESIVETALELRAPLIRVWAGAMSSVESDDLYWNKVVSESRRIADIAASSGMYISYEFHSGTLTDTNDSTLRLLKAVSHSAVKTHWQPPNGIPMDYCMDGLQRILPALSNIHVFHWNGPDNRRPLAEGSGRWLHYLNEIASAKGEHFALLEFVKDDDPNVFREDAATLRDWLYTIN